MTDYFTAMYVWQIYGPAYIVTEVIFAMAVAVIFNRIRPTPKGILKLLGHIAIVWAMIVVVASVWQWITGSVAVHRTIMPLTILLYMIFFSRYSWRTRIVEALTFYSAHSAILVLSESIGYVLRMDYGLSGDMTLWSNVILTVLLAAYLYAFNFDTHVFVPNFCVIIMCASTVVTYVALEGSLRLSAHQESYIFLTFSLFVLEMLCYAMFSMISRQYGQSVEKQVMSDRKAGARDMLLVSRAGYDNIHVVLHDVKNQFATLRTLLDGGKYDEAIAFLDGFELFASPAIEAVDCGNVVIDSAMAVEQAKARQKGLSLDTTVMVPPALSISDSDLVSVICNLLDNAIESCSRENCRAEPIAVQIRYQRDYLFIQVTNPVSDAESKRRRLKLHTSKPGMSHGYGARIVRDIAERYNGLAKFSVENERFIADVMLALPPVVREKESGT